MSVNKQTFRAGPFHSVFAQGVRVGNLLHLSGQVSLDAAGQVLAPGDFARQLEHCYANVGAVLHEFGGDMTNVVDETLFVTNVADVLGDLETFGAVRERAYGTPPEVSQTLVQVAALVLPELCVEVRCVAHL